jgi:hypothetical protein
MNTFGETCAGASCSAERMAACAAAMLLQQICGLMTKFDARS